MYAEAFRTGYELLYCSENMVEYWVEEHGRVVIQYPRKDEWECWEAKGFGKKGKMCKAYRFNKECFHVKEVKEKLNATD